MAKTKKELKDSIVTLVAQLQNKNIEINRGQQIAKDRQQEIIRLLARIDELEKLK